MNKSHPNIQKYKQQKPFAHTKILPWDNTNITKESHLGDSKYKYMQKLSHSSKILPYNQIIGHTRQTQHCKIIVKQVIYDFKSALLYIWQDTLHRKPSMWPTIPLPTANQHDVARARQGAQARLTQKTNIKEYLLTHMLLLVRPQWCWDWNSTKRIMVN